MQFRKLFRVQKLFWESVKIVFQNQKIFCTKHEGHAFLYPTHCLKILQLIELILKLKQHAFGGL